VTRRSGHEGAPAVTTGTPVSLDLRSRRSRRFALRWRRPRIPTHEALEVLDAFAARHSGDERAVLGELISVLLELDGRRS
jgi:hypothetical protein